MKQQVNKNYLNINFTDNMVVFCSSKNITYVDMLT